MRVIFLNHVNANESEETLLITELDIIPLKKSKVFLDDKHYLVFDIYWQFKTAENAEPYVEIILVHI